MGSFWNESAPQIIRAREAITIRNRCRRAKETSFAIIRFAPYWMRVGELQEQAAVGNHGLALLQPAR